MDVVYGHGDQGQDSRKDPVDSREANGVGEAPAAVIGWSFREPLGEESKPMGSFPAGFSLAGQGG